MSQVVEDAGSATGEVSDLESGKDVQDLKSQLGKAMKQLRPLEKEAQEYEEQLKNVKLENETLKSTLGPATRKSSKTQRILQKEREIQHEEGMRIAVENGVQQAPYQSLYRPANLDLSYLQRLARHCRIPEQLAIALAARLRSLEAEMAYESLSKREVGKLQI